MKADARETALRVLTSLRTAGAWADAALKAQLDHGELSGPDAALTTRLVYGVIQNRLLLDFWIGAYCSQKPDHLQYPLADILRLGAYQIVFLDKIPDSAAVNEAVNMTKAVGRAKASGLVNAVLRKIVANKGSLPYPEKENSVKYLSITESHPQWIVKRLLPILGPEETAAFLRIDNQPAPMTVQVNPLKTTAEALTAELEAAGIAAKPHSWVPGCLELGGTGDLRRLPAFVDGKFMVQDAAAHLVTCAAGAEAGSRIIDVCAAPGGKSFALAMEMKDRGEIFACDLHASKLSRIREGASRLGLTCIQAVQADGREQNPQWVGTADAVLVDAPCSGLGIIRKKPDIRYKKPDELLMLPVIQQAILENAASYVRPGGTLVYSTCTILPEENQQVVDSFLAGHPDFAREGFALPEPADASSGEITLWPQRNDTDGFYICRMRRNKG